MKKKLVIAILILCTTIYSQESKNFITPDSLKKLDFTELKKRFEDSMLSNTQKMFYGNTYYKKSKYQNDKMIIMEGLYMAATLEKNKKIAMSYLDSIISLSDNKKNFTYPAKAYILKSEYLLYDNQWNDGLTNLLKAEQYAEKEGNIKQNSFIKQQMGLIKTNLGKYEEALPLVRQHYYSLKLNNDSPAEISYSTFLLADLYNRLEKTDSALHYSKKRLKEISPENRYYKYLIMSAGISYHIKKDYKTSNALLDKAIPLIYPSLDKLNLAICYYYRGMNVLQGEKKLEKAKIYFEKVDSIMVITKEYTPDIRNNYINLIEISKKLRDDKKQLYYLNRLIEIDKDLNKNDHTLSKNVTLYYDTPHLLAEKEKIISKINNEKYVYIVIGCFIFMVLFFCLYFLIKIKREKKILNKLFYDLMNNTENELNKLPLNEDSNKLEKPVVNEKNNIKSLDLPIAKELLEKLIQFEKECSYLELNLRLVDLADRFYTNSSYLSKTINHYKGKNFSQYLNDLRIDYAVDKLKKDKKLRKYTVKALAEEFGFNNSESFAKAFYSNTGLQPSYFIKKISEDSNKSQTHN